jgi:hypothetical protein
MSLTVGIAAERSASKSGHSILPFCGFEGAEMLAGGLLPA